MGQVLTWRAMVDFLQKHEKCENDLIIALDIIPNVMRIDCDVCAANLQVRYEDGESTKVQEEPVRY